MKIFKEVILTILAFSLYISSAQAACDFIINIGDKKTKLVEKIAEPMPTFPGQFMLPVPSTELCPNDNLDMDIAVEYIFLEDNLAAIRMVVLNDGKNTISEKLTLMNYAKKVYGDFDTGQNPKIYNNFNVWKKSQNIVIYKRLLDPEDMIEEEIFITNKKYDEKLGEFYYNLEINESKEDENTN
jgi:hypothetical protein|tara:strand:- start:33 stop:584 length:552 start_codon:yes stop_codon:yes gene_type:complete